jgi:hypothetical protein
LRERLLGLEHAGRVEPILRSRRGVIWMAPAIANNGRVPVGPQRDALA